MMMKKDIAVINKSAPDNSGYVPGSPDERIALVWPITREAVYLSKKYDVEQRLQRHITRLIRKKS